MDTESNRVIQAYNVNFPKVTDMDALDPTVTIHSEYSLYLILLYKTFVQTQHLFLINRC